MTRGAANFQIDFGVRSNTTGLRRRSDWFSLEDGNRYETCEGIGFEQKVTKGTKASEWNMIGVRILRKVTAAANASEV